VSKLIPDVTRLAWREKQDDIRKLRPDVREQAFVYTLTRQEYDRQYGTKYQKPGFLARFIVFMVKVLPKVGPLSVLAFRVPTPEAERLFIESFLQVRQRYGSLLDLTRRNALNLQNTDFDTGQPTARGEYPRADEAYTELRDKLANKLPTEVPIAMQRDLARFFGPEAAAGPRPTAGSR
jgi:hypothetical protein